MVEKGTDVLKEGFAKMTKGGVIMDVVNAEQASIAEDAGAVAVMALEKVPADIQLGEWPEWLIQQLLKRWLMQYPSL